MIIKNLKLYLFVNIFSFAILFPLKSQQNEIGKLWENKVYKDGIKTVLLYKTGWELSMPIIQLNSSETVSLSFDEINQKRKNYSYAIIHCNANWQQSELEPIDYLRGNESGNIENYNFSQNTMVDYINYQLDFPTEDCKLQVSGNYIIKVFEDDDPTHIVLTARFYVYEKMIDISAKIEKLKLSLDEGQNQRVNFQIKYEASEIENPVESLSFKILKNNETEKDFPELKPSSINENILAYQNIESLTFTGGNEYRHFDTKSFKFLSDCLEKIDRKEKTYYITIKTDPDKANLEYKNETDLNGKRLIKLENIDKSNIMADYSYINFELKADLPLEDGNYYIFGSLSNWALSDEFKMNYNQQKSIFEKQVFLKQGYYNYKYFFKSKDKRFNNEENEFRTEGNHFQTENDYSIFIYYKPYNENFQKLVGFQSINSSK
jgi:hypothetical protein